MLQGRLQVVSRHVARRLSAQKCRAKRAASAPTFLAKTYDACAFMTLEMRFNMWFAVVCVALTLSATANAGRDFVNARALLQTADIESVANAVAQQPSVPQMVSVGHARHLVHRHKSAATWHPVNPGAACNPSAIHVAARRFEQKQTSRCLWLPQHCKLGMFFGVGL